MFRTLLYDINTVKGIKEYDFLSNDLASFPFKRDVQYHTVTEQEIGRYDLIAQQYYGNVDWWWIIAASNEILNPIEELVTGVPLVIPNILDVYDYYQSRRKR